MFYFEELPFPLVHLWLTSEALLLLGSENTSFHAGHTFCSCIYAPGLQGRSLELLPDFKPVRGWGRLFYMFAGFCCVISKRLCRIAPSFSFLLLISLSLSLSLLVQRSPVLPPCSTAPVCPPAGAVAPPSPSRSGAVGRSVRRAACVLQEPSTTSEHTPVSTGTVGLMGQRKTLKLVRPHCT